MAVHSLSAPVLALMERTLFATSAAAKPTHIDKALNAAVAEATALNQQIDASVMDRKVYALGAVDVMRVMLVSARERHAGDRAFAFARRKHVRPLLRELALSDKGLLPSEIAKRLRLPRPRVSSLLAETDRLGLTERVIEAGDAKEKRRRITDGGKLILESIDPCWAQHRASPIEDWLKTALTAQTHHWHGLDVTTGASGYKALRDYFGICIADIESPKLLRLGFGTEALARGGVYVVGNEPSQPSGAMRNPHVTRARREALLPGFLLNRAGAK
jgi:DNA-binding MarR family transcriptional regulator